jgi:hypothetical protein
MKVGKIVGTWEIREVYIKCYPENLNYGVGMEDSGVNGRIIIKWFLNGVKWKVQVQDKNDRQVKEHVEMNVRPLNKESD